MSRNLWSSFRIRTCICKQGVSRALQVFAGMPALTQRSNAKIQRHYSFLKPRTCKNLKRKPLRRFQENVINVILWEKSWEHLRMFIRSLPGHMRSIKLAFSVTVLTLDSKAKFFPKFKTLLSESFGGNCARAPRLTAVWLNCVPSTRSTWFSFAPSNEYFAKRPSLIKKETLHSNTGCRNMRERANEHPLLRAFK